MTLFKKYVLQYKIKRMNVYRIFQVLTCIRQQKTQYLKNRLKLDMLETIALNKDDFVMQEKPQVF